MFKFLLTVIRFVILALERVHAAREIQIQKTLAVMAKLEKTIVVAKAESTTAINMAGRLKALIS